VEPERIEEGGLPTEEYQQVLAAEASINGFIERRVEKAKDAESAEELWARSVRKDREKRRQAHAEEWYEYHDRLIRSHQNSLGSLVLYHQKERARYAKVLGLPEVGSEGAA
jgi:hypothetical protein